MIEDKYRKSPIRPITEIWTQAPQIQSLGADPVVSRIGTWYNGDIHPHNNINGSGDDNSVDVFDYTGDLLTYVSKKLGYQLNRYWEIPGTPSLPAARRSSPFIRDDTQYTVNLIGNGYVPRSSIDAQTHLATHIMDVVEKGSQYHIVPALGSIPSKSYFEVWDPNNPTNKIPLRNASFFEYDHLLVLNMDALDTNRNGIYTQGIVLDVTNLPKRIMIYVFAKGLKSLSLHDPNNSCMKTSEDMYRVKYHKSKTGNMDVSDQALITVCGMNKHVISVILDPPDARFNIADTAPRFATPSGRTGADAREYHIGAPLLLVEGVNSLVSFAPNATIDSKLYDSVFHHVRVLGEDNIVMYVASNSPGLLYTGQHIGVNDPTTRNGIVIHYSDKYKHLVNGSRNRTRSSEPIGNGTSGRKMAQWWAWLDTAKVITTQQYFAPFRFTFLGTPYDAYNIGFIATEGVNYRAPQTLNTGRNINTRTNSNTILYGSADWTRDSYTYRHHAYQQSLRSPLEKIKQQYKTKLVQVLNEHLN